MKSIEGKFIMERFPCLVAICALCTIIISCPNAHAYCVASGGCDEYIYGVSLGSIDTWGTACNFYIDYSGTQSTAMEPGQSYGFEVVTAVNGNPYTGYEGDKLGIWIDFNGDDDFDDAGEFVYFADDYGYFSGIINVPADADGGATRMRIRLTYDTALYPCGNDTYGEVEDYGIILPSAPQTRIHGKKWHDLNDNGEIDGGEPALSGWTIFLDEDHDGEIDPNDIVTTTDLQGDYEFTGMEPNNYYHVSELDEQGWINTYPGAGGIHYQTWVGDGNDIELNFGNYQLHNCDISGYKFEDLNNNGVWDDGETPLAGWEIYIDENENGQWDSGEPKTTTNASGYYEFTNLEPGYYNIMEIPQAGWFQTYPGLTSGRLWGLERLDGDMANIAEANVVNMTIEKRFAAPYEAMIIGASCLAVGPSTLFYCAIKPIAWYTVENLIFEIDPATGLVLDETIIEMPQNEAIWNFAWHKGILYAISVETPTANPWVAYLNRYDPFTKELISRDPLIEGAGSGMTADPYEDLLLSNVVALYTLFEIDPDTATVLDTIIQQLPVRSSIAYTQGVLYKALSSRDEVTLTHRHDGSLLATEIIPDNVRFDTISGGIGTKAGHRIWIGKRDIEANFGGIEDSQAAFSGTKYEDINGNGVRDLNEPGIAGWPIYVDLDGDTHHDPCEPIILTDANGQWTFDNLSYGSYFVREEQSKGYNATQPAFEWTDWIYVNGPRDIIFDDLRNTLYITSKLGTVERYSLSTNEFLSPISLGGSPYAMDIAADYGHLYVTNSQLSDGNAVVHKINLDSLAVADLTYTVDPPEQGSYDIAIGSEGIALFTSYYDGSILVPLYVLDTRTDTITTHPDIMGATTIRNNLRLIRSHDRSTIWLANNSSNGWVGVYDAASNAFITEHSFNDYLTQSPIALNRDGSLAAVQLYYHCRIVDADFNLVMGMADSRMAAEFDPSDNMFYLFQQEDRLLFAFDTLAWELLDTLSSGLTTGTYEQFSRGETAMSPDGRVLGITEPNYVLLQRKEYYALALPGRTTDGLDFGNKHLLCGDIDRDRDVDFLDLACLAEDWLCHELSMDIAPVPRDYVVNMPDFARFSNAWLSHDGDTNWDRLCDIAPPGGDGLIDTNDLAVLTDDWLLEGMIYDSDVAGSDGPDGYVNMVDLACLAGNWRIDENIIEYDEDFETGDFSKLPWEHAGDGPWIIESFLYFEGSYSARSAALPAWEDESILRLTTTCGEGNIHFMVRVGADGWFQFRIDEAPMFNWISFYDGGLLDWSLVSIPVSAGTHTFEWSTRPGVGDDFAWIDAIRFPPANN